MNNKDRSAPSPSWWDVIKSIFAAALGVQSEDNRARDFTHGKPIHYIIGGLIFTILFISSLLMVVYLVTSESSEDAPHPAQKYQYLGK